MSDCACQTGQNKIFALTQQMYMKGQGGRASLRAVDSVLCKTSLAEGLTGALGTSARRCGDGKGDGTLALGGLRLDCFL